jgi:hypothetical protein
VSDQHSCARGPRASAEPHLDQLGSLAHGETQVRSRDLEQFTPSLRAAEPQVGQAPAGQHEVQPGRRLQRQHPEQVTRRLVVADVLEAVEDQEQVARKRFRELAQQCGAPFREDPAVVGTDGGGEGGAPR